MANQYDIWNIVATLMSGYGDIRYALEHSVSKDCIIIGIKTPVGIKCYELISWKDCQDSNVIELIGAALHEILVGGHHLPQKEMDAAPFSLSEIEEAQDMIERMK